MRLTEKKSVEKYLQEVRKEFKAGRVLEDLLETSAVESVEEVKKACPDFLKAAVSYIKLAEVKVQQGYIPTQSGLVCDSYEERKQLQRTFTLDDMQKIKVFYPDWWLSGYELFIYHLMEALFDASLMIEQGAERKFRELVTLYRSFKRVEEVDGWYFAIYEKSVLFINTLSGKIFSLKKSRVTKFISDEGIKEITRENEKGDIFYYLVLNKGRKIPLMKNQNLTDIWHLETRLKDFKKQYQNVVLKDYDLETKTPAVQVPSHIIILLARFGINPVKHLILKDSLITCDHLNMEPSQNSINNLEMVTRKDNLLRAKSKDVSIKRCVYSYNLGAFWEFIEGSFKMARSEVRMRKEIMTEYWTPILKEKAAEEILLAV